MHNKKKYKINDKNYNSGTKSKKPLQNFEIVLHVLIHKKYQNLLSKWNTTANATKNYKIIIGPDQNSNTPKNLKK